MRTKMNIYVKLKDTDRKKETGREFNKNLAPNDTEDLKRKSQLASAAMNKYNTRQSYSQEITAF